MDFYVLKFGLVNYGWKVISLYNKFDNYTILQESTFVYNLLFTVFLGLIKFNTCAKTLK